MTTHRRDTDCTLDADLVCVECGVDHGGACLGCDGRGFHRDGCPELCAVASRVTLDPEPA